MLSLVKKTDFGNLLRKKNSKYSNDDSMIDILDVVQMVNLIMNEFDYSCESDINSDGIVDILDIISLVLTIIR